MGRQRIGLAILLLCASACAEDHDGTVCGDGTCSPDETSASCELDCPASGPHCGDGACNNGESNGTCAADCAVDGPFCGDGACNGTETNGSCPADCPASVCSWAAAETCSGDMVCVNQTCVPAYGRVYAISVVRAEIAPLAPDSSSWDGSVSPPDPFCIVSLNGPPLFTTSTSADTLTPTWNEGMATQLAAGSELTIECWDEDVASDDHIMRCTVALAADVLHVRDYRCTENGSWVDLSFLTN